MTDLELVALTQKFNQDLIIGHPEKTDEALKAYSFLSDSEFDSKTNKFILCGEIAQRFNQLVQGRLLFLYHNGVKNWHDLQLGQTFISAVENKNVEEIQRQEDMLLFDPLMEQGTHMVVEVGGKIVDPTAGLVYPFDINCIKKSGNFYTSWFFYNQINFIKKSIHLCRGYFLAYLTSIFWKNVTSFHRP
jgi:hypothetical protein